MYKIKKTTKRTKSPNKFEVYLDDKLLETIEVELSEEKVFIERYELLNVELLKKKEEEASRELSKIDRVESKYKQGTIEWRIDRLGLITSSNTPFRTDGTPIANIRDYAYRKACENFSFNNLKIELKEGYKSPAMENGNLNEQIAIDTYSVNTLQVVESKNLIKLDGRMLADSIDGYIRKSNKGLEVKCPETPLPLLNQILHGTYIDKYIMQIHTHMLVLNLDSVDFVVHFEGMKQSITNIKRDDRIIANMMETLSIFESYYADAFAVLKENCLT